MSRTPPAIINPLMDILTLAGFLLAVADAHSRVAREHIGDSDAQASAWQGTPDAVANLWEGIRYVAKQLEHHACAIDEALRRHGNHAEPVNGDEIS